MKKQTKETQMRMDLEDIDLQGKPFSVGIKKRLSVELQSVCKDLQTNCIIRIHIDTNSKCVNFACNLYGIIFTHQNKKVPYHLHVTYVTLIVK